MRFVQHFPSACHPEPASPSAKQMKFSQWLNAIDLLRKLPKTSESVCIPTATCHPERSMNSSLASNGSFGGGNAADLQSKLPKTLTPRCGVCEVELSKTFDKSDVFESQRANAL